jgi:uroporphyrinogen decarboxylase
MIDGSGSDDFRHAKTMMFNRPDLLKHILDINAQSVAAYLGEQLRSGAQALMIFDTWGGLLPDGWYQRISLASMRSVIDQLPREVNGQKVPIIIFTKGGGLWLEDMADVGADVIGLDWTMSIAKARTLLVSKNKPLALQGNFDPIALFAKPEQITQEAIGILDSLAKAPALKSGLHPLDGHIFNLGHGISQFTNRDAVTVLAKAVLEHSAQLRKAV